MRKFMYIYKNGGQQLLLSVRILNAALLTTVLSYFLRIRTLSSHIHSSIRTPFTSFVYQHHVFSYYIRQKMLLHSIIHANI